MGVFGKFIEKLRGTQVREIRLGSDSADGVEEMYGEMNAFVTKQVEEDELRTREAAKTQRRAAAQEKPVRRPVEEGVNENLPTGLKFTGLEGVFGYFDRMEAEETGASLAEEAWGESEIRKGNKAVRDKLVKAGHQVVEAEILCPSPLRATQTIDPGIKERLPHAKEIKVKGYSVDKNGNKSF